MDDGSLEMKNRLVPHGTMPIALPRLGLSMILDKSLENMRWYGRGPHENYIDRFTSAFFGLWDSTVSEQYVDYIRPQDNGFKSDVRWVEFTDSAGAGVRFSSDNPMFVQALHHQMEDMLYSRHRAEQARRRIPLVKRPEIYLNLDLRQLGLGGNSCGPKPLEKYIFPIKEENWTVRMDPVVK
jgi:beta-galactosidase